MKIGTAIATLLAASVHPGDKYKPGYNRECGTKINFAAEKRCLKTQ